MEWEALVVAFVPEKKFFIFECFQNWEGFLPSAAGKGGCTFQECQEDPVEDPVSSSVAQDRYKIDIFLLQAFALGCS